MEPELFEGIDNLDFWPHNVTKDPYPTTVGQRSLNYGDINLAKHEKIWPMTEVTFSINNLTIHDHAFEFLWDIVKSKIFINMRSHR